MAISGLGPHGERAAAPERVLLLPEDLARSRAGNFKVGIVLHTLESDWAQQLLAGIVGTLGDCGVAVIDVIDSGFSPEQQCSAIDHLIAERADAIISLPVANNKVAAAHARVADAGIKLVLLDNVPTGLLPGKDYVSLISADNFGLGRIASEELSKHLPTGAELGVLGYEADFFVTNEREIAFVNWMQINRPDVKLQIRRFPSLKDASATAQALMSEYPDLAGMFVVWDTPAMAVTKSMHKLRRKLPVSTVDLGRDAAISLAANAPIVAIAAQQPFRQGQTVASTTVTTLLGRLVPAWIALPGVAVTRDNVVECFQTIWRRPAPREVLQKLKLLT